MASLIADRLVVRGFEVWGIGLVASPAWESSVFQGTVAPALAVGILTI